jgi:Leucine-rich repeat (LRR) protein
MKKTIEYMVEASDLMLEAPRKKRRRSTSASTGSSKRLSNLGSNELWGELRAALSNTDDSVMWDEVASLLQNWPDESELENRVIPYLSTDRKLMTRNRACQWEWLVDGDHPAIPLCNDLVIPYTKYHGPIKDDGVKLICDSPFLEDLTSLSLRGHQITNKGAEALASCKGSRLEELDLSKNSIGIKGLSDLFSSSSLRNLSVIDLARNKITSKGALAIAQNNKLSSLSNLDLSYNVISDEGALALAESNLMKRVMIDLRGNPISQGVSEDLLETGRFILTSRSSVSDQEPLRLPFPPKPRR